MVIRLRLIQLAWIFLIAIVCYSRGAATNVAVYPESLKVASGVPFSISIVVNDVTSLHAVSVRFSVENSVCRVTGISQGDFLKNSGQQVFFSSNPLPGTSVSAYTADQAILGLGSVTGSGVLFTVNCSGVREGVSLIDAVSIDLRDDQNGAIGCTAVPGVVIVGSPGCVVSPLKLDFGNVLIGHTEVDSIQVSNSGNEFLNIDSISTDNSRFSVVPGSLTLGPAQSSMILVSYSPIDPVMTGGIVSLRHNGRGGMVHLTVKGKGELSGFSILATVGPHGTITPAGNITVMPGKDTTFLITPDQGYITDSVLIDELAVTPSERYTFSNVTGDHEIRCVFSKPTVSMLTHVARGWNLISLPLIVPDYSVSAIFSSASGPAYSYEAGYHAQSTLINGIGYWIKYNTSQDISIAGKGYDLDTIALSEGWNLLGTISAPVPANFIVSTSANITFSQIFDYSAGYRSTDTLKPGSGYWIKASGQCSIIVGIDLPPIK